MTDSATASTAADLSATAQFLLDHPDLPTPWGASLMANGGLSINTDRAAQVDAWAEAIDREATVSTTDSGAVVHSVYTFEPFYISVTYVDLTNEVTP